VFFLAKPIASGVTRF